MFFFTGMMLVKKKVIIFYGKAIVFSLYVCIFAP